MSNEMAHLQYIDDLIKEYLVFRGFTSTLRFFENDLKNDKDKGFRVDRITNQILSHIQTHDLNGLQELWHHLDQRIFIKLSPSMLPCIKKFETSIFRLYVINAIQTNKPDKVHEFFEKLASELQKNSDWKEWFVLPYLRGAEDLPTFAMYFTRQWQDTLFVSFQNFLAIVFQNMSLPTLASYQFTSEKIRSLQEENEQLRVRLKALTSDFPPLEKLQIQGPSTPPRLADDFHDIKEPANKESQSRQLKGLFRFSGESSSSVAQSKSQISSQTEVRSRRVSTKLSSNSSRRRSSSLAPASGTSREIENSSTKVVSQTNIGPPTETKALSSRSPSKTPSSLALESRDQETDLKAPPFLLIARESYPDHRARVSHTIFNHTGTLLASGDTDGVVKLWSPYPSPKTVGSVVMKGAITSLEWLPKTEKLLLIASKSSMLKLYDTQEKKSVWDIVPDTCLSLKDQRIMSVKGTPSEGQFLMSVSPRNKVTTEPNSKSLSPSLLVFDLKSQKLETAIKLNGSIVNTCVTNHNGGLLICGCNDGYIKIVDLRSSDVVVSWAAHQGEVFTVKLSPHEDKIYSLGSDNRFSSWSLAKTGTRLMEHTLHEKAAGPFLVGVGDGGGGFGDLQGRRTLLLRPYGSLFALHQDDQFLFTCSANGPIIYKMKETSLCQVMSLKGHSSPVITLDWCSALQCGSCVAASLDGKVSLTTLMPQ